MVKMDLLQEAKRRFCAELNLEDLNCEVVVSLPLSPRDAIGDPGRDDFPILRGREVLMQAVYKGAAGQAFTSAKGSFRGTLRDALSMPLAGSFERAVLVSTINATLRYRGLIDKTVHCKDEGPKRCADRMASWIAEQHADAVGLIGMQPALLEALVRSLGPEKVMVSDLAEAGSARCGVKVLDGMDSSDIFERCQLILITGSTIVNGTIGDLLEMASRHRRRVVFFGTTIAGVAYLLGMERWCPSST
ncbi:MAG: hypothetical protein A4E44_01379 [Methanosaeta sp. PtaB.Bin018]|jgi:uncharacterized protein (DUF4213/DUF364 family)|nr:hypothetical protein [Methanothrix sp.]OPX75431.1 MAG: hypothetical protein A4E44_01379 [Methanosaeta sp. PtaB.Bin018]OPY46205.1 MAG: hypothetical protein A4E46_00981 [Methanosaeta sp. PtaU1.Bin016]